jgi:hypothetical protein
LERACFKDILSRFRMQSQDIQTSLTSPTKTKKLSVCWVVVNARYLPLTPSLCALPADLNKSIYYSLIEHLLHWLQHHHQELTCYEKIKLVLSITHSNGYGCFAKYCISVLEHGDLPTEPLMKGFHEWCISQYGTVDGGKKDGSQTQARWSKGYALHEELYVCCAFHEYILLCHTNKWTPMKAHAHLKTHPSYWWPDSQWVGGSSVLVQSSIP